jgi:phage major head subunit gpT-like protein
MAQEAKPVDWYLKIDIYKNEIDDDQTGELINRFNGVARSFQRHKNKRVFTMLNAGDSTTYGTAYDDQQFFDSDHADEGAEYQTDQDNEYGLALSADNYNTVWAAAQRVKDDRGEVCGFDHNLLIASPELKKEAHNIAANEWDFDSADRTMNPFMDSTSYITVPEFDSAAWVIAAINESVKPMILVNRMMPYLQEITFDPNQERGGRFTAHYHARYVVVYGDWRLCFMGNT